MDKPWRMYFLCVHNRCRSQMAKAFARHFAGNKVIANSAGVEESQIHPLTIEVMKEVGIDISDQQSKRIDMKVFISSQIVIKLCEQVNEKCPIVPFGITNVQWDIPDPTPKQGGGTIEEFRVTRDLIRENVLQLLKEHKVV
ncbi:arsenate reductase ArsC [Paenibacillus radicis (ex Xue et al. 2023)]|nr:arsenate reductase ArsC [Paenibacillus radicis (ex Xue et al. 2023)]